jgi:hypothetical protein
VNKEYAAPLRHGALTDSRPSATVTLTIPRVADLAVASLHNLCEHPDGILNILRNLPQINSHLNGYSS